MYRQSMSYSAEDVDPSFTIGVEWIKVKGDQKQKPR